MNQTNENTPAFFNAVMTLAATNGWRRSSLGDIADATGLSLADLQARFNSKQSILSAFAEFIDAQVLATKAEDEGSARDRLFDVLMRRFDALKPYKDGLAALVREGGGDGVAGLLNGGQRLLRSMSWMLEAAGIGSAGLVGAVRTKGLAAVYASTFMTWLRDDTEDLSRTMAALDRSLARAERLANMSPGRRRSTGDPASDDGASGFPPPPGSASPTPSGPAPGGAAPPGAGSY